MLARRRLLGAGLVLAALPRLALALRAGDAAPGVQLDREQSRRFRAWLTRLVEEQVRRPNPRWTHRDCAGLVRFAAAEAFSVHDDAWRQHNGFIGVSLPPPLELGAAQRQLLRNRWLTEKGEMSAFASAAALIQHNSRFLGRDYAQAEAGDLLFYDQGDDQHLMVWMGGWLAYHTGSVTQDDNGLRAVSIKDLLQWKDTRWRPLAGNPNFAGLYRFSFLAA